MTVTQPDGSVQTGFLIKANEVEFLSLRKSHGPALEIGEELPPLD